MRSDGRPPEPAQVSHHERDSYASRDRPADRLLRDQSVAKQLLLGDILEENLFPYPVISEREREMLGMIVESVDRFLEGKEADFAKWDREAHQPDEYIQALRELGLFGLIIPEEFGGLGLSNAALRARARRRPAATTVRPRSRSARTAPSA